MFKAPEFIRHGFFITVFLFLLFAGISCLGHPLVDETCVPTMCSLKRIPMTALSRDMDGFFQYKVFWRRFIISRSWLGCITLVVAAVDRKHSRSPSNTGSSPPASSICMGNTPKLDFSLHTNPALKYRLASWKEWQMKKICFYSIGWVSVPPSILLSQRAPWEKYPSRQNGLSADRWAAGKYRYRKKYPGTSVFKRTSNSSVAQVKIMDLAQSLRMVRIQRIPWFGFPSYKVQGLLL